MINRMDAIANKSGRWREQRRKSKGQDCADTCSFCGHRVSLGETFFIRGGGKRKGIRAVVACLGCQHETYGDTIIPALEPVRHWQEREDANIGNDDEEAA